MKFFSQKNGEFFAENVPLSQIAKQFGSPTYVYSKQALTSAFERFSEGFSGTDHLVCFAVKSNPSLAILNTFAKLGAGFDIVSGGEMLAEANEEGALTAESLVTDEALEEEVTEVLEALNITEADAPKNTEIEKATEVSEDTAEVEGVSEEVK